MITDTASAPIVLAYDPTWPERALALTDELRSDLGPLVLQVDHIGSTAIPGMAAKPVFDVQITVADLHEAEGAFDRLLVEKGFRRSLYRYDHVPAGVEDDRERWTKRLWTRRGQAEADCNLHVRLLGSPNERLALLFRDWFRAHPEAVPAYGRFKSVLAGVVRDLDVYADVKDPVVDLVVTVAESWAASTGWTPHSGKG
ncbi:GrpB family protein [Kitasatospora griseola]|uniref:GrpB family protein n=1 Tax=Kitasatospora griseola TaxID=2064 RepID=UPI0019C36ECD|nr:GrpB family protein [Kitasatospora griseola]GGQ78890.1 hypothetical protein GCM10010195_38310 [Kitasatospora griseola]